jgi:hypothetical protein
MKNIDFEKSRDFCCAPITKPLKTIINILFFIKKLNPLKKVYIFEWIGPIFSGVPKPEKIYFVFYSI